MGSVTHKAGQEGKKRRRIKVCGFPKLCFFLPGFVCLFGARKGQCIFPEFVGILFLFRSSVSSKHFAINGVKTNKSLLLNPCVFV